MERPIGMLIRGAHLISMAAIFVTMVLISTDVVLRYFFSSPIMGTVEIVELLQVVVVSLALSYTLRADAHVRSELVIDRLSKRKQGVVGVFTNLLALVVFSLMAYSLAGFASDPGTLREVTDMLEIPVYPFHWVLTVGVCLLCLQCAADIVRCARAAAGSER